MSNSQSSVVIFEDVDVSITEKDNNMGAINLESLLHTVKEAMHNVHNEMKKTTFSTFFAELLDNFGVCLNQILDLITGVLSDTEVDTTTVAEYLNEAVSLLQLLTDFLKTVIETVSMSCNAMEKFPITTGMIIVKVLTHCKESESLYGHNLRTVEQQLKDLFRNCHELQLTYLMILEKHYVFDLDLKEEQNILVEALEINLRIGEIVHSLDVKFMAEQWKAYTAICEKYNTYLKDTKIFQDCTKILCIMIKKSITNAIEENQDEKVILRSLKVASFTIKILLKVCNIFKNSTNRNNYQIINLFYFIHLNYEPYLRKLGKSEEFMQLTNDNITVPSEYLLKELLMDETFVNGLLVTGQEILTNAESLTALTLVISSVIKCVLNKKELSETVSKSKLISCIYTVLPHFEISLNQNLMFSTLGIYEHLVIHTTALSTTMNNEEFNNLEKHMIEAILDTDCCSALFSSNLWTMLARYTSSQLLFNQLIWLCTMYKKLECHQMFNRSPQKVHLGYTISGLFRTMADEDKLKICKQFRIHDDANLALWTALRVENLSVEYRTSAEEAVVEKLKAQFSANDKSMNGIITFINLFNLTATCTFTNAKGIDVIIIKAWMRACPHQNPICQDIDNSTEWFLDYISSLAAVTETVFNTLLNQSVNVVKILHVVSSLIQKGNSDLKLILIHVLCKLSTCEVKDYRNLIDTSCLEAFTNLMQDSELVRNKLIITLKQYKGNKHLDRLLSSHEILGQTWLRIKGQDCHLITYSNTLRKQYYHKCYERVQSCSSSIQELQRIDSNFEFDVEELFDPESEEPVSKKVKLDELEIIVNRLETDSASLCSMKENIFTTEYKTRIERVCDKLRNIIN